MPRPERTVAPDQEVSPPKWNPTQQGHTKNRKSMKVHLEASVVGQHGEEGEVQTGDLLWKLPSGFTTGQMDAGARV